jgi:hypothetical protein
MNLVPLLLAYQCLITLARNVEEAGELEQALQLYRRAVAQGEIITTDLETQ